MSRTIGALEHFGSQEEIIISRLRDRANKLDRRAAEEKSRTSSLMTATVVVMLLALMAVLIDQTQNSGGGSGVSIIAIIAYCEACGIQSAFAFVKKRTRTAFGFLVLNVLGIAALFAVIIVATGV